jgi:hypothetical protein
MELARSEAITAAADGAVYFAEEPEHGEQRAL